MSAAITGEIILMEFPAKGSQARESPHSRGQPANVTACFLDVDAELLPVQHHRTLRSLHPRTFNVTDLVRAGELAQEDGLDGEVGDAGRGGDQVSRGG